MANRKKTVKVRIVKSKLRRERALGVYYPKLKLIKIDSRLTPKHYLSILVHELLHYVYPHLTETAVKQGAPKIAQQIWNEQYRRLG